MYTVSDFIRVLSDAGLLIGVTENSAALSRPVSSLTYDSREVRAGTLFLCKGAHFVPEYAVSAALGGAVAYVSEKPYPCPIPGILVSDIRLAMPVLAQKFYDNAPAALKTIGVTGTKGKSTVVYMIRSILDTAATRGGGKKPAILSSIDNDDGITVEESHLTTPESTEIFRHCANAVKKGLSCLVMEASSQALKYHRLDGIHFQIACFTNIGSDHISPIEHPDFEDYFASKLKIFEQADCAVINADDPLFPRILEAARANGCRIVTYALNADADMKAEKIHKNGDKTVFDITENGNTQTYEIGMPGIFNVSNALCAVAVARLMNVETRDIQEGLLLARASGRMEVFSSADRSVVAIVDYAHNAMSFQALFSSTVAEYPGRRIFAVFGSAGKKAFQRRIDLPQIASAYCEKIYFTEEDSGEEPFSSIASDLSSHASCPYEIISDRPTAIRRAITENGKNIVVLITGKGREETMKRGMRYEKCESDVSVVQNVLGKPEKAETLSSDSMLN